MRPFRERFLRLTDTLAHESFVFVYVSLLFAGVIVQLVGRRLRNEDSKLAGWILMSPFALWLLALVVIILIAVRERPRPDGGSHCNP
jgi:hypothetical protein